MKKQLIFFLIAVLISRTVFSAIPMTDTSISNLSVNGFVGLNGDNITRWSSINGISGAAFIVDGSNSTVRTTGSSIFVDVAGVSGCFPLGFIYQAPSFAPPPTGSIDCDGSEVSRATYLDLYSYAVDNSLIGPGLFYGYGDGSTTFSTPDLAAADSLLKYVVQYTYDCAPAPTPIPTPTPFPTPAPTPTPFPTTSDVRMVSFELLTPDPSDPGVVNLKVTDLGGNPVTGVYLIDLWFIDALADISSLAFAPPTVPGLSSMVVLTDNDGEYQLSLEEVGALSLWYLVAELQDRCYISGQIVLGD